ncbi:hypothetical protein [Oceanirhabdus sp. W0125-5]|uniref:hypothetical protein n=1 Tax=Oceanirhabdus sp. W0125-5 TaxID=2999116 RepID=UPI0022F2BBD3|nr:hypothetical protein [Oceanirhabdus sp. W0125-5]WBW96986.1 hypothetical protein OW730_25345 [Oceanirhabdus sp. W0125-5]
MNLDMLFGCTFFLILGFIGFKSPKFKFDIIFGWIFEKIELSHSSIKTIKYIGAFELVLSFIFFVGSFNFINL